MINLKLHRSLLAAAAIIAMVIVALSLHSGTANAESQPPQSRAEIQRLQGRQVTVHLRAEIPGEPRKRESLNGFAMINDVPVSITGRISDFASEGGMNWVVLSRSGGDAWVPVSNIQLIVESPEQP